MVSYYIISSLTGNSNSQSETCAQESRQLQSNLLKKNQLLVGRSCRYIVRELKGKGVFGEVAKCLKEDTGEPVAVKILKRTNCLEDVRKELAMLMRLRKLDPRKNSIVHFLENFEHRGHPCLVFEMLDRSLYDLFVETDYRPFSLAAIRLILVQLLQALEALKSIGVIHTDIKRDNIMLINHAEKPYRVKLIDFGLAISADHARLGMTCQPASYRAPEVVLGLPITEAIDIWSLGCLFACLYSGKNLFCTDCPHRRLSKIVRILGQPRDEVLDQGLFTSLYFEQNQDRGGPAWTLQDQPQYGQNKFHPPSSLDDLMPECENPEDSSQVEDRKTFVDLLERLLAVEADRRITTMQAMCHDFTLMAHLTESVTTSSYSRHAVLTLAEWSRLDDLKTFGEEPESSPQVAVDMQIQHAVIGTCRSAQKRKSDQIADPNLETAAKKKRGPQTGPAQKLKS